MADEFDWLASMSTWIRRQATDYTEKLNQPECVERVLLEEFEKPVQAVLSRFDPPAELRQVGGLVFAQLYTGAQQPPPDEQGWRVPSALLIALLAAETEFRGPYRLGTRQNLLLAEVYELLGGQLREIGLPWHAARAYRRATALYRIAEDVAAQDRCGLESARARTAALPRGTRQVLRRVSDALCGYGYRPFLLLGWVIAQLVVFSVIGILISHDQPGNTLYMTVTTFLNPQGLGDADTLSSPAAKPLFAVEAWLGAVSMSVFFALLVRKWFRM